MTNTTSITPRIPSLDEYYQMAIGKMCFGCCKDLVDGSFTIDYYQHEGGWQVAGFADRQWLATKCSCGYCTSLTKIQIAGKATWEEQEAEEKRRGVKRSLPTFFFAPLASV